MLLDDFITEARSLIAGKELMTLQSKLAASAKAQKPSPESYTTARALVASGGDKILKAAVARAEDEREGISPAVEALGEDEAAAFESAVIRYTSLSGKIKALEAKKDGVKAIIFETVTGSGFKTLLTEDYSATYTDGAERTRLDPKALMEAGVTAEQLAKGTVTTKSAAYVTVREIEARAPEKPEAHFKVRSAKA